MSDNQFLGMDDAAAAVLHQDSAGTATAIRNNVQFAIDANPDQEAQFRRLAAATGVPLETVRNQTASVRQQVAAVNVDADRLTQQAPHLAQFLTNMDNARLIHDDVPGTANVEGAAKAVATAAAPPQQPQQLAVPWQPSIGQRIRMWLDDAFGATQRENARSWIQFSAQREGVTPDQLRQDFGGMSEVGTQATSKLVHAATFGIVPDMAGEANTGAGAIAGGVGTLAGFIAGPVAGVGKAIEAVGVGGLQHVAGESFAKALAKDVSGQALKLGAAGALGEVGTAIDSPDLTTALQHESHAFLANAGMGAVFGAAGRLLPDTNLLQSVARIAGIQSTLDLLNGKTPYQDIANWDRLSQSEKGNASLNILLNGVFGMKGAGRVQGGWFHDAAKADLAAEDMGKLQTLSAMSAASKLRERDPAAFKQFVSDVSEDGALANIYVDGNTLVNVFNQSGIKGDDLQRLMPEVAQQLSEATQTNGDVRISVADYATHIAGTPLDEALLPNLKTAPDGMTYAEGQEFQKNQAESLKAAIEQESQQQAEATVALADRQHVYDSVLAKLNAANRYAPDVNAELASMQAAYYATTAERLGITPGELFAKHPLNIAVERLGGEELEQALSSQPPEGWRHLENGEGAADLWNGKDDSKAVFWSDLAGKLDKDAPEMAGYSHSISSSTMSHIKKRHGGDDEVLSGQVPITEKDMAAIPSVVTSYDAIRTDMVGKQGQREVGYAKRMEDGVLIYVESESAKRRNLSGVSMWKIDSQKSPEELLQSALTVKAKGQDKPGLSDDAPRPLSDYESDAQTPPSAQIIGKAPGEYKQGSGARGAYNPETNTISLLKDADLSTFLHESGHQFLEMTADLASQPEAPESMVNDFHTLLKWFGVQDSNTWHNLEFEERRAYHEQFARGFEAYLMEGKAPSVELTSLFARFRSWLINVYKNLAQLNVRLTPEVRAVMGRMLASDEAIKQAEQARGFEPLFESAEAAGMSPEEFAEYRRLGQRATDSAVADMQQRSIDDMRWLSGAKSRALKEMQAKADDLRAEATMDARREVMSQPLYRAWEFLTRRPDDEQATTRINAKALGRMDLRPEDLAQLKKLKMVSEDGTHPDLLADRFGFNSGVDLVESLARAEQPEALIKQQTDQLMLERHGELATPEAIERAAEAAIHNRVRARFVATELRALQDATRERTVVGVTKTGRSVTIDGMARAAKQAADGAIAAKRVRDLNIGQYTQAEARAARNADEAMIKGDLTAAANEKRAQLLNNALVRSTQEALQDAKQTLGYFRMLDSPSARKTIDLEYREQIYALLDQYDLRTVTTGKELDRRQSLREWYANQIERGFNPSIPDSVMDNMVRQHYKDMTVEQLRGLRDTVKSIEYVGRMKKSLIDGKDVRDFDAVVAEATDAASKLPQRDPESRRGLSRINEKWLDTKSFVRSMDASLLKMEQVFDWLDKHDSNGVFNRVVFRRIADAGVRENDLRKEITTKLRELGERLPDATKQDLLRIIPTPELVDSKTRKPGRLTKGQVLAMALNSGNESNFKKMAQGENWDPQAIWTVLDRTMSKGDWDFVQGVWDTIDTLYPEIAAMERRLGNVAPEKVVARAFTTQHGEYRGGYYPVVYDPQRSFDVEQNRQRSADQLFENNYVRATTPKGHTIARTEGYQRPILLDMDVLPRHITQVIHDIAYREVIMDADRFLSDPRVREAVENTLGPEIYKQFRPWLQGIANDKTYDNKGMSFWNQAAHWARTSSTMVGLGLRITTMEIHGATAASNSVGEIGAKWFAVGVKAFAGSPERMAAVRDFVFARSGEMRHRMNENERDVRDGLREMELRSVQGGIGTATRMADPVRRFAYYGISMLDMASAMPTWMGAYCKGLHENMSEQDAVYYADKAVRNAHGGGGIKDQAAFQRGDEYQKLFGMFYSFWNHFYNRQRDIARTAAQIPGQIRDGDYAGARRDFAMVLARSWYYFVLPQLLHAALKPPAADEDHEKNWAVWAAEEIALGLFSGIPVVRDLANSAFTGRDYQATPAVSIVQNTGKTAVDIKHAVTGEPVSDKWLKHAITTSGYVFGLPTGQPANTAQFLWDLSNDKTHPQDLADWYAGIVHGDITKH